MYARWASKVGGHLSDTHKHVYNAHIPPAERHPHRLPCYGSTTARNAQSSTVDHDEKGLQFGAPEMMASRSWLASPSCLRTRVLAYCTAQHANESTNRGSDCSSSSSTQSSCKQSIILNDELEPLEQPGERTSMRNGHKSRQELSVFVVVVASVLPNSA